jgi:hypothetical protein
MASCAVCVCFLAGVFSTPRITTGDYEVVEIRTMSLGYNWVNNRIGQATLGGICRWLDVQESPFLLAVVTQFTGARVSVVRRTPHPPTLLPEGGGGWAPFAPCRRSRGS